MGNISMFKQKIINLSLVATAIIVLAGCGDNKEKDSADKK